MSVTLPEKGRPWESLQREMQERAKNDVKWRDGKTAVYVFNPGDEVLIPSPDYPLWSAAVSLNGGLPRYYECDSKNAFQPDIEQIESLITPRSKAIVVISKIRQVDCDNTTSSPGARAVTDVNKIGASVAAIRVFWSSVRF